MVRTKNLSVSPRRQPYCGKSTSTERFCCDPNAVLLVSSMCVDGGGVSANFRPSLYKLHFSDLCVLPKVQRLLASLSQLTSESDHGVENYDTFTLIPAIFEADGSLSQTTKLTLSGINVALTNYELFEFDANKVIPEHPFLLPTSHCETCWEKKQLSGATLCGQKLTNVVSKALTVAKSNNVPNNAFLLDAVDLFLSLAADKGVPDWLNCGLRNNSKDIEPYIAKHFQVYNEEDVEAAYKDLRFQ